MSDIFDIKYPKNDIMDLTKSDKELFEYFLKDDDNAVKLFNTWSDEEELYTNEKLCFTWQIFKMYMKTTRIIDLLEKKIAKNEENI